ncbi:MAG: hypothetical protein VB082_07330 [Christensenella sp.]|nr:hypothetical protein [Christensenella sp.]
MNGNRNGIGIGGVSILAVFVVLCLTTLAVLSLVSARADYALTQKVADATTNYYAADSKAQEKLAYVLQQAQENPQWQEELAAQGYEVSAGKEGGVTVVFTQPVDENRILYANILLSLDKTGNFDGTWDTKVWKTKLTEEKEYTGQLNVLK